METHLGFPNVPQVGLSMSDDMVRLIPSADPSAALMYYVPAGTVVMMSNSKRIISDYTTKRENSFPSSSIVFGTGIVFTLDRAHKNLAPIFTNASQLAETGFIVFTTGDQDWPYMAVEKCLFENPR